jgi:uncharacterized protein
VRTNRILFETILITAVTLIGMWFLPAAKTVFAIIPVAYLLMERRLRKRTWSDLGFKISTFWSDLRANWIVFIVAGFVMQPATALWAKAYFPEYLMHVQARLPFESGIGWGVLLPMLAVSLIGEEMTYRTMIQGRLAPFIGVPAAIGVGSVLFGLAHYAPGPALIVALDVSLIVVDSILYGVMFARRNNLWVVWLAHLLGDILGLLILISM